jgi:hypothetical protein
MDSARELRRQGRERSGVPIALVLLVGAVLAGGSGIGVWQWQKRRGRAAASMPAAVSSQPVPVAATVAVGSAPVGAVAGGVPQTMFAAGRMAALTCTRGKLAGQRFSVTAGGLLVGRQPGVAHVVVQDSRASGQHVWIKWEDGKLVAVDQGTTNGTFVNDLGHRISRAELRDGDVLIVADPDCLSLAVKLG